MIWKWSLLLLSSFCNFCSSDTFCWICCTSLLLLLSEYDFSKCCCCFHHCSCQCPVCDKMKVTPVSLQCDQHRSMMRWSELSRYQSLKMLLFCVGGSNNLVWLFFVFLTVVWEYWNQKIRPLWFTIGWTISKLVIYSYTWIPCNVMSPLLNVTDIWKVDNIFVFFCLPDSLNSGQCSW